MKNIDWNSVEAAEEFKMLPPGGYICKILRVEDHADKEYLRIEFDIVDGEQKDYFLDNYGLRNFWPGYFIRSYKAKAQGFFKQMLIKLAESNPGFKVAAFSDEKQLINQLIGLTIGHEKYWNKEGNERTRLYVDRIYSVQEIKNGDFKAPQDRENDYNKPKEDALDGFQDLSKLSDDDVPF